VKNIGKSLRLLGRISKYSINPYPMQERRKPAEE
jgi:hypothetical protein